LNKALKINFVLCRIPYFFKAKDKPKEAIAKKAAMKYIIDSLNSVLPAAIKEILVLVPPASN